MKSKIKIALMVLAVGCCAAFAARIATAQNDVSLSEKDCSMSCPAQKSCSPEAACETKCPGKPCGDVQKSVDESNIVACGCSKPKDGKLGYEKPAASIENNEQALACACPARKGNGEKPKTDKV